MANNKYWNEPVDLNVDWGGDTINTEGKPLSGRAVQDTIKNALNSKVGYVGYCETTRKYVMTKDEASFIIYDNLIREDRDSEEALRYKIADFTAPFEHSLSVNFINPESGYMSVLQGTTGVEISFSFLTKDSAGAPLEEAYSYKITSTQLDGTQKIRNGSTTKMNPIVTLNIDDLLSNGTNNITITATGQDSNVNGFKSLVVKVITLRVTDRFDISTKFSFDDGKNTEILNIPHDVTTNATTSVKWYIDNQYCGETTFNSSGNNSFRYTLKKGEFYNGVHSIMYFAEYQDKDIAQPFRTNIYYRNFFIVDNYTGALPLFSMSFELPYDEGYLNGSKKPSFFNIKEYDTITLPFAIYTTQAKSIVDIMVANGGSSDYNVYASVEASPGRVITQKIVINKQGSAMIKLVSNDVESDFVIGPFDVVENSIIVKPSNENLILDLDARGRDNNYDNREIWISSTQYGEYQVKFNNFQWNSNSGWNNDKLLINNGSSIEIPFKPFEKGSLYKDGYTFEIEFSTKNIYDENAEICKIMSPNNDAGIVITASEATFYIDSSHKVFTKFKSGKTYRIAFVKTPTGIKEEDYKNNRFVKIYVNGVLCGVEEFGLNTNFSNDSIIKIEGTQKAEIELGGIRIIQNALTDDEILNNYMFYRTNAIEKNNLYLTNNIYEGGVLDIQKIKETLPVMVFYQLEGEGAIEDLELEFSDKKKTVYMDIDYTNNMDPSLNFYIEYATVTPQGTSSMKYPKKNYRFYTQKHDNTKLYLGENKDTEKTGKKRKYSFKNKTATTKQAAPVKCWCLKADFAESSGTHNTGVSRYWNNVLVKTNLLTKAQEIANSNNYKYDVRTTVDGFPIALFYKPLNGEMRFLGKYNFNNDKSTEDVFGFTGGDDLPNKPITYLPIGYNEPIIHTESKQDENGDTIKVPIADLVYSDGEDFNGISPEEIFNNPNEDSPLFYGKRLSGGKTLYYMLQTKSMFDNPRMECWEILSSGSKLSLFLQTMTGDNSQDLDGKKEKIGYYDDTNAFQESFESRFPDCGDYFHTYNLQRFIKWLSSCQYLKSVVDDNNISSLQPMTIDELKALDGYTGKLTIGLKSRPAEETFKFAFGGNVSYTEISFDKIEEDVKTPFIDANDEEVPVESYRIVNGMTDEYANSVGFKDVSSLDVKDETTELVRYEGFYYCWGYRKVFYVMTLPSEEEMGYKYVYVYPNKTYHVWKDFLYFSDYTTEKQYDDTPENRALKFAVEKYDHFKLEFVAAYYIYLMRFGGVDQTVKNAMLTTEGSDDNTNIDLPSKWYFINYDNDTILGVKNDGRLVFDPYINRNSIEVTTVDAAGDKVHAYCYAGRNSVMWNNLEEDTDFMSLVPKIDDSLQNVAAGLSYENTIDMFNNQQAGQWCERIYNWDAKVKYIDTYSNRSAEMEGNEDASFDYLLNVQGPRSAHREWWLSKRFNIFDSYYTTGTFKNDIVTFKCNGPSSKDDVALIYSGEDIFYGYYKNQPTSAYKTPHTIKPGESWELTVTADSTVGDPHAIFGAPNIEQMDLRGISHRLIELQMQGIKNKEIGTKLNKLLIGDTNAPKINTTFSVFGATSNMEKLEVLDVTGCNNLTTIPQLPSIKELYIAGTGVQSVNFQAGNINKLELPIDLTSLTLNECTNITWDDIAFYDVDGDATGALKTKIDDFSKQRNLVAIEIIDSPSLLTNHDIILSWVEKRVENQWGVSSCRLSLDRIDWHLSNDEVSRLLVFNDFGSAVEPIKDTLKGKITVDRVLTLEEVTYLTDIFEPNCFDKGADLEIVANKGIYIAEISDDGHNITEGGDAKKYKLVLVGGDGVVNISNWRFTLTEIDENGYAMQLGSGIEYTQRLGSDLQITIKVNEIKRNISKLIIGAFYDYYDSVGHLTTFTAEAYTINVHKLLYPNKAIISGPTSIAQKDVNQRYELKLSDDKGNTEFNGNYFTEWEIYGEAAEQETEDNKKWVEIVQSDKTRCDIVANYIMNSNFTLKASVYRNVEGDKLMLFNSLLNISLKDYEILLVENENPALFKLLYDNGFTNGEPKLTRTHALSIYDVSMGTKGKTFKEIFKNYTGYTETIISSGKEVNVEYRFEDFSIFNNFSSITSIPDDMFRGCKNLQTIILPDNTYSIGKNSFSGCSINHITIPIYTSKIDNSAFESCSNLSEIIFPDNVQTIGSKCFYNCYNLLKVTLNNNITEIQSQTFKDCYRLQTINNFNCVTKIGTQAFDGCKELNKLSLSEDIIKIDFSTTLSPFMGCYKLIFEGGNDIYNVVNGTLYFNDSVKGRKWIIKQNPNLTIKDDEILYAAAYSLCGMNLNDIVIPSNIRYAGSNIMNGSSGNTVTLTTLFSNATHETYNDFFSLSKYNSYKFMEGETLLPNGCFRNSENTSLVIPDSIETIGEEAFYGSTKITQITIPSKVKIIGYHAFGEMSKLNTITLQPLNPPVRDVKNNDNNIIHKTLNVTMYVDGDAMPNYINEWDDYVEYFSIGKLPEQGMFRIIKNGELHLSDKIGTGEFVDDVYIGNDIGVKQHNNGYYEFTTTPSSNTKIFLDGLYVGDFYENYCTIFLGNNTSLYTDNGVDFTYGIYDNSIIVPSQSNSWVYDAKLKGYRSNTKSSKTSTNIFDFSKYEDGGYVYMTCGQMSESKYDFTVIRDEENKLVEFEILECKGQDSAVGMRGVYSAQEATYQFQNIYSNYIKIKLPIRSQYKFEYKKDFSQDLYHDAFWIKTVGNPIFIEPLLPSEQSVTFNIISNDGVVFPSYVKINVTNNTFFDNNYVFDENNRINITLPKNETFIIKGFDFMIGGKWYKAFDDITINTSADISEVEAYYTTLYGNYVYTTDGNINKYNGAENPTTVAAYIFADDENDYFIQMSNFKKLQWSTQSFSSENKLYVNTIGDGLNVTTETYTDGYENTKEIIQIFGNKANAAYEAKNDTYLTDKLKIEWYLPSVQELMTILRNFKQFLPSSNNTTWWTSNLKDSTNAWLVSQNGQCTAVARNNAHTIIKFGRLQYDN